MNPPLAESVIVPPLRASDFFVTGGTLRHDAISYVERQADKDLYDSLVRGEFCYILTSRQMGKSSLMVRTAKKLRAQKVAVAVIDLTSIGQNLSAEQWYNGLLERIGRHLLLEAELEQFWQDNAHLGPLHRLIGALQEVVLPKLKQRTEADAHAPSTTPHSALCTPHSTGRLVIFVDEIDVVRSLPFATDEFFAAFRECYNRRAEDPEFNRLTFCLLGVAAPADLIRDPRLTPFNIGQRIELRDFTESDAAPLASGLQVGKWESRRMGDGALTLIRRALYWTGGHPYLMQRLCRAVAQALQSDTTPIQSGQSSSKLVDRLADELFLSPSARERDDNLVFVRERLLRSEANRAGVLELYSQVWRGKCVPEDETNPLVTVLRLAGITRGEDGRLLVRNRIYNQVFDAKWIRANMPDDELRRQRAAYRRGLIRATLVGFVVVILLVVVAASQHQLDQVQNVMDKLFGTQDKTIVYHSGDSDALVFWTVTTNLMAGDTRSVVVDDQGREFDTEVRWLKHQTSPQLWQQALTPQVYPRRSKNVGLRLYQRGESNRWMRIADLNPITLKRTSYPEWTARPLPVANQIGDLLIILTNFVTGIAELEPSRAAALGEPAWTYAAFQILQGGKPAVNWHVAEIELSDATGNLWTPAVRSWAIAAGEARYDFRGALWPNETAWKLKVELSRAHQADFQPEELWTLRGLELPPPGGAIGSKEQIRLQGVTAKLLAVTNASPAVASTSPVGQQVEFHFRFSPPRKGVRLAFVNAKDDRGQILTNFKCSSLPADSFALNKFRAMDYRLGLVVPATAKSVDLTIAVQKSFFVEFIAAPSWIESRE